MVVHDEVDVCIYQIYLCLTESFIYLLADSGAATKLVAFYVVYLFRDLCCINLNGSIFSSS
jgi:hypothetical protein